MIPIMRLSAVFFICTSLFADESAPLESQTYNYVSQFVNMLMTLGFVLALIFASVWLLKKIMRSRMQTLNRCNGIKILERRPLHPKASLYLVDILGKGVVISESPAGIQTVTEFPQDVNVQELLEEIQETQVPAESLPATLAKTLKKGIVQMTFKK
jgi:flagellar biosynthetic protein FliO